MSTAIITDDELLDDNTEDAPGAVHRKWLMAYLENGGVPDLVRTRPTSTQSFDLITRDCTIPKLCGASSRSLFVAPNVEIDAGSNGVGHNDIYYLDNHETHEHTRVTIYSDELPDVVEQYPDVIEQMDGVEFLLQAVCAHDDCSWESPVTDDSDRLLHKLSKHACETEHGVIPREVVPDTRRDMDGRLTDAKVVHSRRYNAGL